MTDTSLRERYVALLMDRMKDTSYPSPPMLDRIESAIGDRDTAEEYVSSLLERVEQDRYPSPGMLDRLSRLIAICEAADR